MEAITMAISVFDKKQKIRLLPFLWFTGFFLIQPYPQASFLGVIFKILPILSLIGYVTVTRSQFPTKTKTANLETLMPEDPYSVCVLAGLCISVIGDILVAIPYLMFPGGFVFMFTHLAYFVAIEIGGRHRGGRSSCTWLYSLLFLNVFLCTQASTDAFIIKIFLFMYFIPSFLTAWKSASSLEENRGDTAILMGFIGSSLFIFSDMLVIMDHHEMPIPFSEFLFMLTYYGAQFGWAVSTSNFHQ